MSNVTQRRVNSVQGVADAGEGVEPLGKKVELEVKEKVSSNDLLLFQLSLLPDFLPILDRLYQ